MKARIGFVSNSSSSSFVLVGYKLKEEKRLDILKKLFPKFKDLDEDALNEKYWDQEKIMILEGPDDGVAKGTIVVGKIISEINSESYEMQERDMDFKELEESVSEIKELLDIKESPRLITGTRSC